MNTAESQFEKALLAIKDRKLDLASSILQTVLILNPDHAEAWMLRGNIEHAQFRPLNALLHHDRAVAIAPDKHDAWCNRGIAAADLGLFKSAEECYRRSIELCDAFEPHVNLANMYCHEMRLEKAADEYRAAIAVEPANLEAHTNLGVTLLGMGQWDEGFAEYASRHANTPYPPRARRRWPSWQGEDLTGKTILLYPEQGYGDEIMALRFANTLVDLGATVVVEARAPMYRIAAGMPFVTVIPKDAEPAVPIDFSCALLDVPGIAGISPAALPFAEGYLPLKPAPWIDAALPRGLRVGLCWNSGQRQLQPETESSYRMKSIPLDWLKPLIDTGAVFVSLQKDGADIAGMAKLGIHSFMGDVHDFMDTAQIMAGLDLVISVDTAVAHLAGALGLPVWNFVRFNGYWPWLRDKHLTPWYRSMRLYRQPSLGDWNDPINRAAADLAELVKQGNHHHDETESRIHSDVDHARHDDSAALRL